MKPISLVMEGFGSYITKTEIDFTAFADNSLFLITGCTGGGKTTILDAICFALYGKATGGLRSWEQMRSIGADESTPTSVDFTFALGQRKYRFYRCQKLYHGRKDGTVKVRTENSCYDLTDGEKLIATGSADRNITLQAQALLGLDCDQFSRVMVLPQGEFRKLLLSSSSEKSKLFEKLFDAQQWTRISTHAIEKADAMREQAEALVSQRQTILLSHGCQSVTELEEKSAAFLENQKKIQNKINSLDTAIKSKQEQVAALKRRDELSAAVLASKEQLASAENEREKANEGFIAAEKRYNTLQSFKDDANKKREELRKTDELLNSITKVNAAKQDYERYKIEVENTKKENQSLEEQIKEILAKIAVGEEYVSSIRKDIESIPTIMTKLQTLKEIGDNYKKLDDLKIRLQAAEKENSAYDDSYKKILLELDALKEQKNTIDQKLNANMSVYLSTKLENGKPCPVCGSTVHPAPALSTGEAEKGLVKKQKALDALIKEKEADCSAKLKICSAKAAAVSQLNEELSAQQDICNGYNIYYKTFKRDLDLQNELLNNLMAKKAKLPNAETRLADLKAQLEKLRCKSDVLSQRLLQLEKLFVEAESTIKNLTKQNNADLESESALKEKLELIKCEIIEAERQISKIQTEYTSAVSGLKAATALVDERKKHLKTLSEQEAAAKQICENFETKDTKSSAEEYEMLNERLKNMLAESGEIKRESESLANSLAIIKKKLDESHEVEQLYSTIKHLADILRGNNPMKVPIKMFVLGMMLDDILLQANKYFSILSDGRYKLEKTTEDLGGNSLRGLDIEVFDGNYGGKRPVFTLSGGEMFLASLSLAFGLSDVVQSYSGGIRLDSIFIDEGFGSLDSETVDTAMRALDRIKSMGRTVGIISHISQLSEKIGNKIVVTSDNNGSHAKIVTA